MPTIIRSKVRRWLSGWGEPSAGSRPAVEEEEPRPVDAIRCQMVRAVRGCTEHHRALAADKVMRAVGVMDLWLLRSELFQFLACDLGQAEAGRRMNGLRPLFRGHVEEAQPRQSAHNALHEQHRH